MSSGRRGLRSSRERPDQQAVSIIARDLRVDGTLSSSSAIRIEGTVVGTIQAEHQVLVARRGTVEGDIHSQEAILDGEVVGSIFADGRVEVQASAVIHGDITTPSLSVEEGAVVRGQVHMAPPTGAREPSDDDAGEESSSHSYGPAALTPRPLPPAAFPLPVPSTPRSAGSRATWPATDRPRRKSDG